MKDLTLFSVVSMIRFLHSSEVQEICGVIMQFLALRRGLFASIGSVDTTSTAAPATLPEFRASARSPSLIRPPRALLTIKTPSFIFAMFLAFISSLFSALSGQCKTMASDFSKSSSRLTKSTKPRQSSGGCGVFAITFMFIDFATLAVCLPIAPRPIIPRVFPASSMTGFFQ